MGAFKAMITFIIIVVISFMWAINWVLIKEIRKRARYIKIKREEKEKREAIWRMSHRIGRSEDV